MSWRLSISFAVAVSAGAMGVVSSPVRADDAYLCGPDKIVYVALADLENMKRTDPCIAAYYGLKVEAPVQAAVKTAPDKLADANKSERHEAPQFKGLSEPEVPGRISRNASRQASLEPPRASEGTDYRNVKILNASAPDAAWYRHTR